MTKLVVGIDGGGSKTVATIADATGRVLGSGRAGTSNHDDVAAATVAANLQAAVTQARREASVGSAPLEAAFLGLGGVVSERDRARVREILATTELARIPNVEIDHDIRIALAGGLAGRPGAVVIVGTGSACYGRLAGGASWRAGGWGPLLADEGSGYWFGLQALVAAVRMHDGRLAETPLKSAMLERLGVTSADDAMHRVYVEGLDRAEIAALAPTALRLARSGDEVARELVDRAARELGRCVVAVATRLGVADRPLEVSYAGGVIERSPELRTALADRLGRVLPQAAFVDPELPPARGACLLALERIGVDARRVGERLRDGE